MFAHSHCFDVFLNKQAQKRKEKKRQKRLITPTLGILEERCRDAPKMGR